MKVKKKSKILVTGAAGFIGSNLVEELVREGEVVRCFLRKGDDPTVLLESGVEIVWGDITDKASLVPAFKEIKTVYHLAAKTDFMGKNWKEYYLPNVIGTRNLADLAIKGKVNKFVFFSTIRTIGLKNSKEPISESAPYDPKNYYDRSKVEAEKILLSLYKEKKFPVTIIRPSSVYGPRDRGTYFSFFKSIKNGLFFLIGSGNNLVSFVFVKNVVDAAILAAKNTKSTGNVYFITDKRPYSIKEISETIAVAFGGHIPGIHIPLIIGYFVGYCMDFMKNISGLSLPLSTERVKNLTISYVFDINKAKKELNYNPKFGLSEGVKRTVDWYERNGWL